LKAGKSKPPPGIRADGGVQVDGVRLTACEGARCHAKDRDLIELRPGISDKFK
jgi:hypothetical protein